jgi:hypothetical protein
MKLRKYLILRKLRSGCLEGRNALIPPSYTVAMLQVEGWGERTRICAARGDCHPGHQFIN